MGINSDMEKDFDEIDSFTNQYIMPNIYNNDGIKIVNVSNY